MDKDYRELITVIHTDVKALHTKLDNHLERISKAEESITWIKGHIKVVTTLGVAAILSLVGFFIKK